MRTVLRLFLIVVSFFSFPAIGATYYTGGGFNFVTAVDACKAAFANNGSFVYGSTSGLNCLDKDGRTMFTINQANCTGVLVKNTGAGYNCVPSCPSGQVNISGVCKVKPTCQSGTTYDVETNSCPCDSGFDVGGQMVSGDVYTACKGGCKLRLYSGWYDKTSNLTWGYDWKQTGDKCTVSDGEVKSPTDPKVEDAKRCPVGQCPGNQNGTSVCVPCENGKQTDKTTSSETKTETPSGASSPASTSTKTETSDSRTSCTGDQCTTQRDVTTTNPDGSKTTKTETKTEPKSDYCTDNPKADVCKGTESSWGGECEAGFTCDGDAVQCAQAQAAHQMRCKLTETDTDAISKFNALKSDGLSGLNLPNLTINTPTVEAFGSCPIADTTVDLGFGPIAFPLSFLCPYLEVIHRVITSFGALFWLMIVFVKGN